MDVWFCSLVLKSSSYELKLCKAKTALHERINIYGYVC